MHSFDPEIAKKVGLNAAVIYQNIVWWAEKNAANGKHLHDGRHWTYNSVKAFDVLFPYLTTAQIRRALEKLEASGLILSGTFNKMGYDRTKWYCPSEQIHLSELANGFVRNNEPIPVIKPDIKPEEITEIKVDSEVEKIKKNTEDIMTKEDKAELKELDQEIKTIKETGNIKDLAVKCLIGKI